MLSDTSRPVGAAPPVVGAGFCLECETFVAYLHGSTWKIDLHTVKLIGSLTENYYCVYLCGRLQVWTVSCRITTAGTLAKWPFQLCFPTLGVLKLPPGMLQRTKDDPSLITFSSHFTFLSCVIHDVNLQRVTLAFTGTSFTPNTLSKVYSHWKMHLPSASPEHCGNVAYFSRFPTLSGTSFNTCWVLWAYIWIRKKQQQQQQRGVQWMFSLLGMLDCSNPRLWYWKQIINKQCFRLSDLLVE